MNDLQRIGGQSAVLFGVTRVTDTIEAEPGGFFKLAEPLLVKQQQSQMEADMKKLKELLEG